MLETQAQTHVTLKAHLRIFSEEMFTYWIVNTKLNNFFKGILTIFNWG